MTTKISIPITWPAVPGATKYTVAVSGKAVVSTVPPTVHGLTVANGDAVVITATVPAPPPPPISSLFWLADAPINTPIPANPALDPDNASIIDVLWNCVGWDGSNIAQTAGLYANTTVWCPTVYHVNAQTPLATIQLDVGNSVLGIPSPGAITLPIPAGATTTADSDATLVLLCDTDIPASGSFAGAQAGDFFEFESYGYQNGVAKAGCAHSVAKHNIITGNGAELPTNRVGDLNALFGIITPADIAAGVIQHGIRVATPCAAPGTLNGVQNFYPPAGASDGDTVGGPVSGTQAQLDPTLTPAAMASIAGAALTPLQAMVCQAAQVYGLWFGDSSGAFGCYALSTVTSTYQGYPSGFDGTVIPPALIPHLRVLANHAYVGLPAS